jgi:predicted nucleotidyltransferase
LLTDIQSIRLSILKTLLPQLAVDLSTTDRTLRRALVEGLIHGERPSPRTFDLPLSERVYLTAAWPLLAKLRAGLRTEPSLRLAVLFGSQARGDAGPASDIDLLVRTKDGTSLRDVVPRLETKMGRSLHIATVTEAERSPLLLAEVLRDGRVLIDRDDAWPHLTRSRSRVEREARLERKRVDEAFAAAFEVDEPPET